MAGLLDGWGDFIKTPEGQGLLSAAFGGLAGARKGQPINSIGRAGLAGLSGYSGAEDRALQLADSKVKRGYMQSQIDENASQNAARAQTMKRQQEQDAYFMGTPGAGLLADAPTSPGAYKPSIDGMGPVAPMPATGTAPSMGKFDEWSAQFGIPKDALLADYRANGGKGIADMLYKRGTPDMTVSNGYIFDKNKQGAGFLPSLSTSQSGQTSMTRIGPDGLPVVSAPQGALDVYGAYKTADAGLKPIKVFNPVTQREEYRTEADVVKPPQPATPRPQSPMAPRTGESDQKAIFGQELTAAQGRLAAAKTPEEKTRAQSDIDGLGREMSRLGLSASGNFAAGPSTAEAIAAKGGEARVVDSSKAGAAKIMTGYEGAQAAVDMITSNVEARKSISGGAFQGTGAETKLAISKALNGLGFNVAPEQVANTDYLQATLGQGILNKAKTLGANPTDNDARIIRSIVGSIGTDPNALNKLLDHQDLMANRAIEQHNKNYGEAAKRGFDAGFDLTIKPPTSASSQPARKVVEALPTPNAGNRGQRMRDTATGKVMVSNGLQWKAE